MAATETSPHIPVLLRPILAAVAPVARALAISLKIFSAIFSGGPEGVVAAVVHVLTVVVICNIILSYRWKMLYLVLKSISVCLRCKAVNPVMAAVRKKARNLNPARPVMVRGKSVSSKVSSRFSRPVRNAMGKGKSFLIPVMTVMVRGG